MDVQCRPIIPADRLMDDIVRIAAIVHDEIGAFLPYECYRKAMTIVLEEEGFSIETDLPYQVYLKETEVDSGTITFLVDDEVFVELHGDDTDHREQRSRLAGACHGDDEARGVLLNFTQVYLDIDTEGEPYPDLDDYPATGK